MNKLIIGQRFMSEAEGELGLGILKTIEEKYIIVEFRAKNETRKYGKKSAPLKRIRFEIGDEITSNDKRTTIINEIQTNSQGLLNYIGNDNIEMLEINLLDSISFHKPEEKLYAARPDSFELFNLRQDTLSFQTWLSTLGCRGFIGARLSLIDHQFYLADKITSRSISRVLLADEVGLGKTIEAGLILHKLIITNQISKVLIIVPNTLCFQWFIEMYRKYNLSFFVVNEQTIIEEDSNPFEENNLIITSLTLITKSANALKHIKNSKWDMLIIDEAHTINWQQDQQNTTYEVIESLSKEIDGLLLLTATPEMYGLEGHFARLKLIDPNRFFNFQTYQKQHKNYREMAILAKKINNKKTIDCEEEAQIKKYTSLKYDDPKIITDLLDRHGTGRIYFRNTRKNMSKIYDFFPKRILKSYQLSTKTTLSTKQENDSKIKYYNKDEIIFQQDSYNSKLIWLIQFLEKIGNQKVLLICRSKKKIIEIQNDLSNQSIQNNIALFHSDLSLMARDRQAAYFCDPNGANILLCTEIGSEGRNFEFAHHLILFDLPLNTDLLEQRIGRLDRIGQKEDIKIHVPYLKNSWEEIIFSIYHVAINAFEDSPKGARKALTQFNEEISKAINNSSYYFANSKQELNLLIKNINKQYLKEVKELQDGQDYLVELNSFDSNKAKKIINEIRDIDKSPNLKKYLDRVFTHFGVDSVDLDDDTQFIKPSDNMFIPYFPCLPTDGISITFSRKKALEREELTFITWDHPMVLGIIDLIIAEEFGNVTVSTKKMNTQNKVFIESFHLLESIAPSRLNINKFFPPKTIRVLLNIKGDNFNDKWSVDQLLPKLQNAPPLLVNKVLKFPKTKLKELLQQASIIAKNESKLIIKKSTQEITIYFDNEIERLQQLQKINPTISTQEINALVLKKDTILEHLLETTISLDSFRFIY